ncbi:type VII secretion integral membrane protein EccD [Spirilliplanes yamanashiensis]|uniref:Type VII secretion integral membrane protein EccD n=1 Tax=Spirilliplanes yamanashiensis TaxID=42233 RepID=A0A8J3Y5L5_9ACTN|nr:type VII secretion integral membrane protein EccD [Spirilliplanes yamanashiensis]MDP9814614.1 type VII secretion integral membrane protein EccD [Spirilliplanes yamanashiensis]GIJ02266.1 type VII secretion integral membrane protein EccD [Spirilliplanes yamanashiensis]
MSAGLARVTISAPQRRVDVALPEHVPLVELLPEVLKHAGEGLADDGEKHGGWLLRRVDGAVLAIAQGLFPQGVRDGEVLHLVPARQAWPELEYDDVVEAIADGARRRGAAWTAASTRAATLTAGGVLLGVGALVILLGGPRDGAAWVALGVALLLTVAGVGASRAYGDGLAGAALAGFGLPYAFLGGAALVATGDRTGPLPLAGWIAEPELLAGSVFTLVLALLGAVGVAASVRVFAAGGFAGLLGALTALAAYLPGVSAPGAAAILVAVLVCGIGALPLLAIRFGKVPMPPVALPTGEDATRGFTAAGSGALDAARERPDRTRVFAAVARTEELLTGMLIGHAVLASCAFLVLAGDGWGQILTAVAAAALLLRSRLFVTVRQRVPMITAGLLGLGALALAVAGGGTVLLWTGVVLVLAVLTVVGGATYSQRPPSPYLGRAADLLDTLIVISVVPVACAVLDLYDKVSGLAG